MQPSLTDLVHEWHDFYLLVGTASATLVGLMFVAASIGAQVFTERNREAMRAFISPTVVHFSAALFICMAATIPSQTWLTSGAALLLGGGAGVIYSARVWVQLFVRRSFTGGEFVVAAGNLLPRPRHAIVDLTAGENPLAVRMPGELSDLRVGGREVDNRSAADRPHAQETPFGVRDPASVR